MARCYLTVSFSSSRSVISICLRVAWSISKPTFSLNYIINLFLNLSSIFFWIGWSNWFYLIKETRLIRFYNNWSFGLLVYALRIVCRFGQKKCDRSPSEKSVSVSLFVRFDRSFSFSYRNTSVSIHLISSEWKSNEKFPRATEVSPISERRA